MQTPLRIAENKYKAASVVNELLPGRLDFVHSPFFTNGGLEINLSKKHNTVVGYTTFSSMQMFWDCLREDPDLLASHIENILKSRWFDEETFYEIQKGFQTYGGLYTRSAMMFVLSHLSESGEIFSGKFISEDPKTRISDYALMNLKKFKAPNLTVAHINTDDSLKIIENIPEGDYMVCAPPDFSYNLLSAKIPAESDIVLNHEDLHKTIEQRKNWILIYKAHPKIFSMYKNYHMIYLDKYWRQTEVAKNATQVVIHNV